MQPKKSPTHPFWQHVDQLLDHLRADTGTLLLVVPPIAPWVVGLLLLAFVWIMLRYAVLVLLVLVQRGGAAADALIDALIVGITAFANAVIVAIDIVGGIVKGVEILEGKHPTSTPPIPPFAPRIYSFSAINAEINTLLSVITYYQNTPRVIQGVVQPFTSARACAIQRFVYPSPPLYALTNPVMSFFFRGNAENNPNIPGGNCQTADVSLDTSAMVGTAFSHMTCTVCSVSTRPPQVGILLGLGYV